MEPISVVILIRTDTTLDHSQKAEKVCPGGGIVCLGHPPCRQTTPRRKPQDIHGQKKNDQESHRLRDLQVNFHCLLKPTIPPLSTPSDFACSVSSLGRCSLHYQPGDPGLPPKPPCRARPWKGMDYQRSRCRVHSKRTNASLIWPPLGSQSRVTGPS